MVTFHPVSPIDPSARELLTEYFAARAAEFPGGTYSPVFPGANAFAPPDGVLLLVRDGERIVGCGGIRRLPGDAVRFEVKHVFLRAETRGRGWGRLLLDELESRAREWGAQDLVLDTHHTLEAAGHLYRRSGYVEIEPYNDNPNATRWYRKALSP
ncbi:GNAT superfamily N-acetyltransferase [Microbacterium resistens]|uniref:GNAT superfamily N-acetyltransferase n=1 Tax=Microbacterium resistens TaxID=156977 RepID=A0ABU1SI10_9MICO|nr:GNAT family N-acetyltransferase [Microbacterium resistens]MDR6868658.1 GNAT superfamily N-acetyltransferase [Microbacterium resistens]